MTAHQVWFLFVGLAVILVLTRLAGELARRLGQPKVIGEMAAGILLGPTLFDGVVSRALFPADTRPLLSALAGLGVAVFMFLVGLELDRKLLRGSGAAAVAISATSIVVPFGLGVALAFVLTPDGPPTAGFTLFLGIAMSVTAFPVLARILRDRGLNRTRLGGLALTCAAIDDVVAWSILALVVALAGTDAHQWRLLFVLPYLLLMLFAVRPLLRRFLTGRQAAPTGLAGILAGMLLSAAATEWLGLHYIFGAFLFGVVMPRAEPLTRSIQERLDTFATGVLLPIFFVTAGLQVDLSGLTAAGIGALLLIMVVAIAGKFGGGYLGARLAGQAPRDAAVLASLMNTRGLTELIVLTVGLQLGIIDTRLYSLLVVMALVTTAMTGPLVSRLLPATHDEEFVPARTGTRRSEG